MVYVIPIWIYRDIHQDDLEELLSIFDPEAKIYLDIKKNNFNEKYVTLIERLHNATMKTEVVEQMLKDNLILEEWKELKL